MGLVSERGHPRNVESLLDPYRSNGHGTLAERPPKLINYV